VIYDRAYAPFGEPYAETATTNRNFTGQTEDTTPGLYDFLFRQQSQSQGRWLVPDPAGLAAVDITNPQTWNRYAYVANNPLSFTDHLGLALDETPDVCSPGMAACVGAGGETLYYVDGVQVSESFANALVQGGAAVACPPGTNCRNIVADPRGNIFQNIYSNTLDLNCVGESTSNYQCSWSHWSSWFVYNGDRTMYFGGVQQLINANADLWRNASGAANTLAGATLVVAGGALVGAEVAGLSTLPNVAFTSHGAAHLADYGLTYLQPQVELAITQAVQSITGISGPFWGTVSVGGYSFVYRAYPLANNSVNIGTYHIP